MQCNHQTNILEDLLHALPCMNQHLKDAEEEKLAKETAEFRNSGRGCDSKGEGSVGVVYNSLFFFLSVRICEMLWSYHLGPYCKIILSLAELSTILDFRGVILIKQVYDHL